jgi:Putative beta barrel porin-7 (BBP7)
MNRYLASGLGMTLGLLASASRADEVYWHAPGASATQPAPAPQPPAAPAPVLEPAAVVATPLPITNGAAAPQTTVIDSPSLAPGLPMPATAEPSNPILVNPPTALPPPTSTDGMMWHPAGEHSSLDSVVTTQRAPRLEVTGEYLLWWSKGASQGPPLLTTSPPNGVNGVPGAVPGSTVLLNAGDLFDTFRDGGRFGVTYWLDDCASYGFEGRIFFTGDRFNSYAANSNEFPNGLFRPFFVANPVVAGGAPFGEFREVVTSPGSTAGGFSAQSKSRFWGAEANYRDNVYTSCICGNSLRVDLLAGFRYLNLDESLTMTEDVVRLTTNPMFPDEVAGTHVVNNESFSTYNNFYGGQIGAIGSYRWNKWTADLRTTVALGTTDEQLKVNGTQVRTIPGGPTLVLPGGLLALPTNSGTFTRNVFSVVPEVGLNIGYQVTEHWRAFIGYDFLYWSNVIRPGDQIDRVIDINNIPRFVNVPAGTIPAVFPPRPAPLFNETDFWAQGVNFGVEFRW